MWAGLKYRAGVLALLSLTVAAAQVLEYEANGQKYSALTRNGLTIMMSQLPSNVRDYSVIQVAVSNGGGSAQIIRPEDFLFLGDDGAEIRATPAKFVVDSLIDKASRSDVVKLITSYENSVYGNTQYNAANGYEQRRQNAFTEFTSTKLRAAAAASAIALVQTKLAAGQSTDGAVFYRQAGRPLGPGKVRVRAAGSVFEFPLVSSN